MAIKLIWNLCTVRWNKNHFNGLQEVAPKWLQHTKVGKRKEKTEFEEDYFFAVTAPVR